MKTIAVFSTLTLLAGSLLAADSNPKDQAKAAAKKLGDNYSWKTTVENAGGGRGFGGGATEGKTAGGTTWLSMERRDATTEVVLKDGKGAVETDDGWRSLAELTQEGGGLGFMARRFESFQAPAIEAAELAEKTKALKTEGDTCTGELTEAGAKDLLSFRRGAAGGGEGPEIRNAKGTVTYWIKEGQLSKYQHRVQGTVSFGGNDRDVDRTTTVEFKDAGSTKVEVPDAAKKKLN